MRASVLAWHGGRHSSKHGMVYHSFLLPLSYLSYTLCPTPRLWGWHQRSWLQWQWDVRGQQLSIAEKELIPIILEGAIWGGRQVICHCDNQVVVACIRSCSSKHPGLMHLLRCLLFVEAQSQFHSHPLYNNTVANHLAEELYRNNYKSFLSKVLQANPHPTSLPVPPAGNSAGPGGGLDLTVLACMRRRFRDTSAMARQLQPREHTGQL